MPKCAQDVANLDTIRFEETHSVSTAKNLSFLATFLFLADILRVNRPIHVYKV